VSKLPVVKILALIIVPQFVLSRAPVDTELALKLLVSTVASVRVINLTNAGGL